MKNTTRKIASLLMASTILASGCARTTGNRRDDDDERNVDVEFNTTIDYSELEQCSYNGDHFASDYNRYTFNLMSEVCLLKTLILT